MVLTARVEARSCFIGHPGAKFGRGLTAGRPIGYFRGVSAVDDLRALGAPVGDAVGVARFIAGLSMSGQQQARLLREYMREEHVPLSREILVAARDYSFFL